MQLYLDEVMYYMLSEEKRTEESHINNSTVTEK